MNAPTGMDTQAPNWDAFIDPATPPVGKRRPPRREWSARAATNEAHDLAFSTAAPIDWRKRNVLSAARSQGDANTCTSFAICAAIEARTRVAGRPAVNLAPGFIHTCLFKYDRYRGIWGGDALDRVVVNGIVHGFHGDYPFPLGRCSVGNKLPVAGYDSLDNEAAAYAALGRGPIVADLYIAPDAFRDLGPNDVYSPVPGASVLLHTVVIVGCEPDGKAWIVQNSEGPRWADKGCGLVALGAGGLLVERWGWEIHV